MSPAQVAVIGAGWSGLAAATRLSEGGIDVTLVEAAPHVGGRARALDVGGERLDNGQHILLGAYTATFAAMRRVGVDPENVFHRQALALEMQDGEQIFRLRVGAGPVMPALALALARAHGLRPAERLQALLSAHGLRRLPSPDLTAAAWLRTIGQPHALMRWLWAPLCLAALNTALEEASARVFARTLAEAFAARQASDLMLPRHDLGRLWPEPALAWLRSRQAPVHLGMRIRALHREADAWRLHGRTTSLHATHVILALPADAAADLLPSGDAEATRIVEELRRIESRPITTVWLRDREHLHSPGANAPAALMTGRLDGPAQWVFDRRVSNQPGLRAAVISGDGPHMRADRADLGTRVARQLAVDTGEPEVLATIREKRATFAATPNGEARRPGMRGPWPDLWLAGDSVANGLPATIEGAVRNGHHAANQLMEHMEMQP